MLPPEVIERIKREKEERERPCLRLPLYPPEAIRKDETAEEDEKTFNGVIVIDLL